jgi:cyclopropane fatty-acyl-phospholipid synthase-like methyltransferase
MTTEFVTDGHLGGYIKSTRDYPHGDPLTFVPRVWDWAIATFAPRRLIDVGCGEGHAVKYFRERGVDAYGIEGCAMAAHAGIVDPAHIMTYDFTFPDPAPVIYDVDLVWSCEFVEHVEEQYVENFLRVFDHATKAVLLTHAFPGQGGYHHVNCQPPLYWSELMFHRGFIVDQDLTAASRALAPHSHWGRSGLVFVR